MGPELFEHLGKIEEPVRLKDFHSHIRALDLPAFNPPVKMSPNLDLLQVPVRHCGESLGAISLSRRETALP